MAQKAGKPGTRLRRPNVQFLKDPIHDEINFGRDTLWMHGLLDTPEFKRLHDIKQLGLSIHTFPGASHTRASHCLGAYEIMRRVLGTESFKPVPKEQKQALLCASLLHDLGHAPHSHAFEDYFATSLDKDAQFAFEHEILSGRLITNPEGRIAPILAKNGVDPQLVAALVLNDQSIKRFPAWMAQLTSSELDVDRTDYLLRDSYYTGTNYGNIDANALIHWIRFDARAQRVSFAKKAIPIIENFLIGRYHMYQSVYLNERTSLLVAAMWFVFRRVKDLDAIGRIDWGKYEFARDVLRLIFAKKDLRRVDLRQYLLLGDSSFNSFLASLRENAKDGILKTLLDSYFVGNEFEMLLFDGASARNAAFARLLRFPDAKYFAAKYELPTKAFYAPGKPSDGITIYDEAARRHVPIETESELVKNGDKLLAKSGKNRHAVLAHEKLLRAAKL